MMTGGVMKQQRGAALVVVLSLLSISLMVGVSSMQASHVNERLAGNYRGSSQAQMNAERAASELFDRIIAPPNEDNEIEAMPGIPDGFSLPRNFGWAELSALSSSEGVENNCHSFESKGGDGLACFMELEKDDLGLSRDGYYIISMGNAGVNFESDPVFVLLGYDIGLISGAEAALTCVGYDCGFFAKNPPTVVDGSDYSADVSTTGSISSSDINPDGSPVAAYVVPDGVVDLGRASVTGDRIFNRDGYDDLDERVRLSESWGGDNGAEVRIKSEIDSLVELGKAGDNRITYWDSSSSGEFSMPSSGIVVVDGTDLVMVVPGNFKFTGLVVVRNGSFDLRPSRGAGTVAVVGAIIAQDASVDMQNGNPALLYSSEALCQVGAVLCDENSSGQGAGD